MEVLLFWLAMAFVVVCVVLLHELGRYAFVRLAKLPIEGTRLRVLVRLGRRDRLGAQLGALAAGSVSAYLAAAAIVFASFSCHGIPTGESVIVVDEVLDGFDAAGKLQPGDRLVAVDGEPLVPGRGPSLVDRVVAKQGAAVTLTVRRASAQLDVTIQPQSSKNPDGRETWRLGIRQKRQPVVSTGLAAAAGSAIRAPFEQARAIVAGSIASLVELVAGPDEPDPGGPVRIVEEFRRASEPAVSVAWRFAQLTATPVMLLLLIFDLLLATGLVLERVRARRPAG